MATLVLFNFVAALQGYRASMDAAQALLDEQLRDLSMLISELPTNSELKYLQLDEDIAFQRWQNDQLELASGGAPETLLTPLEPGFGFANFSGYRWRTFVRPLGEPGEWIVVAERDDLRFVLAEAVVLESILPILTGIPVAGILIWTIVSLGLRPLAQLSRELKEKPAHDLSPLHFNNSSQELRQVVLSINEFIRRLGSVLEREQQFSSDAAHELRTPISALKIQLYNLSSAVNTDLPGFKELESGVDRMQHLIEQLLILARTTPEKFAQNRRVVELHELAESTIAEMFDLFDSKAQSIALSGGRAKVFGDEFALKTLLKNLLANANKYTPEGGTIRVMLKSSDRTVILCVEDSGAGIPENDRKRVFDRFFRVNTTDSHSHQPGCGMGLAIVATIAELHQASISIGDSSFAQGTAVNVSFNLAD